MIHFCINLNTEELFNRVSSTKKKENREYCEERNLDKTDHNYIGVVERKP